MGRFALAAVLLLVFTASRADAWLPFGREWAGDAELPRPYGIGVDVFAMNQKYDIQQLSFTLPGVTLPDPSVIKVNNRFHEEDLKADAWLLPFLNVFGIYGHVHARTFVDLSAAQAPVPLGVLPVRYSGDVYGGGLTLAYAHGPWFGAVTGTYADTSLSGDFDSKVHSTTWQPRIGWIHDAWQLWGGAMYLDLNEHHKGNVFLGPLGSVPFDVVLAQRSHWNPSAGVRYRFGDFAEVTLEFGGGSRNTTLLNFGYRFE